MTGISRSAARRNDSFHRYLKPGALAQIRDSRISARSSNSVVTLRVESSSSSLSTQSRQELAQQILTIDQVPDFLSKMYGPYCARRKKLVVARSVALLNLNASSNLESSGGGGGNSNMLGNDVVVAH